MGNNIYLKSRSVNKDNVHKLALDFIDEKSDFLNVSGTELKIENIAEIIKKYILAYQQVYRGMPLWNVKIKFKIALNGQALMMKAPCYNNPSLS
jgi:hypothetical protein